MVHKSVLANDIFGIMVDDVSIHARLHNQRQHDIRIPAFPILRRPRLQVVQTYDRPNGTWMSSFLVNSFMMLLASLGLISFLTLEFESFLRYTVCERLFKHILTNAAVIKYIYRYDLTEFGLVAVFFVVTAYLLSIPSKKSMIAKIMQKKKKERMEQNKNEEQL